jgi:hypothetical protein
MFKATPEAWSRARYELEYTDKPVVDIARDLGTTPNTLRDRARRWRWTMRRTPIPREGPPPLAPPLVVAPPLAPPLQPLALPPPAPAGESGAPAPNDAPLAATGNALSAGAAPPSPGSPPLADDISPVDRLQGAVVAVLANIEAIIARAGSGRAYASENERAARALAALTRTLRELKTLETETPEPTPDDSPHDIDEFRRALARKIDALVAGRGGRVRDDAEPEGT